MDGKAYGSPSFQEFMGDSSNHVKDTRDPIEGIAEQMQRMAKEAKEPEKEKSIVEKWMDYLGFR